MKFLVLLLASILSQAATVTVCASGCTTTSLQTALNTTAACGDTIQIKSTEAQTGNFTITYRGCTSGTPITVTSDRAAWLPPAGARITPSHLANMAKITTSNTSPALASVLDGSNRPPAHWIFLGVAFTTTSATGTFELIGFNPNNDAANSSQISDDITFDRDYFYAPSVFAGQSVQDVIRGDVTNLTVKNSFFGDAFYNGSVESHGLRMLTTAGPVIATNNFITTSSAPIFSGGSAPSYAPAYLQNGVTSQYNYFWRPWKWNPDPAQPYAADYVSAAAGTLRTGPYSITDVSNTGVITVPAAPPWFQGSLLSITGVGGCTVANAGNWRITVLTGTTFQLLNFPGCNSAYTAGGTVSEYAITVCAKNLGELKWGTGVDWQYNVGENSWQPDQCQSQYNGFTDTVRTEWNSSMSTGSIGTFAMSDTTHITWSGTYRIGNTGTGATSSFTGDLGICLSLPTTGTECHAVASFSGASLVSSTAFSAAPGGSLQGWIVYTASAQLNNTTFAHNVFKNVDQGYTTLGLSFSNGVSNAGYGQSHSISNNLWYANNSYITGYRGILLDAAEADYAANPTGYTWDHNTFYYPNGIAHGSFLYAAGAGCGSCATAIQPKFASGGVTNNLFGVSSAGGNGPFSGDGTTNVITTTNEYFASSNIKNNAIPGGTEVGSASGGNIVSGNQYTAWSDPFGGLAPSGIFTVVSSSPYYHAGTDGASLGADFTTLPLINNLAVTPASASATLAFDVSAPIADIKNTQVCSLEVSTSRNLLSDLGTYSVIASLDPTITAGADLSTQSSVTLAGLHVTWPITGLGNGTTYYGRVMCHGDTEWFTFTTGATSLTCSPATHVSPPTATDVQLQTNMALGTAGCTNDIASDGCGATSVQRVINAALGQACVLGP